MSEYVNADDYDYINDRQADLINTHLDSDEEQLIGKWACKHPLLALCFVKSVRSVEGGDER